MPDGQRPSKTPDLWDMVASGVGYHLDNFGRWLIASSPRMGGAYAALLAPGEPAAAHAAALALRRRSTTSSAAGSPAGAAPCGRPRAAGFEVPLTVRWYRGTTVDVILGNDNSLCLYVCGSFEPNEFAFLDKVLRPGMVFVDVGANDGYYTLFAAQKVGPAGRVLAVEPSSRERANLQRNIAPQRPRQRHGGPGSAGRRLGHADLRLAQGAHSGHNTLGGFAHDGVERESVERVQVGPSTRWSPGSASPGSTSSRSTSRAPRRA